MFPTCIGCSRGVGPQGPDSHEGNGRPDQRSRKQTSATHDANLPGTKPSSGAGEGNEIRLSSGFFSGIRSTRIAKMLLPNGRSPHISPCQCGGICGAFNGVAGGTPSLLQMMMVLSSRLSTGRQPAKDKSGS